MEYDATTTRIFEMPPYYFFAVLGVVFSVSLFILLLLKHERNIPRYTKIFLLSSVGLLLGAKVFGFLTGLYGALANDEPITLETFLHTGIVYYGGLFGLLLSFLLICRVWNKTIDYRVVDLVAVCIPLFLFWGRLGCFSAGCCFGMETQSGFSVLYTTRIHEETVTAPRVPIQLIEAVANLIVFVVLFRLLRVPKLQGHLIKIYLCSYAVIRLILELFRGDEVRGVWGEISFSQVVSVCVLIGCATVVIVNKIKKGACEREIEEV